MKGFKRREVGGEEPGREIIGVWKWSKWALRPSSNERETEEGRTPRKTYHLRPLVVR